MTIPARAAVLLLLAGCATAAPGARAPERVDLALDPREWTLAARTEEEGMTLEEYVPPGESAESWTRFISVQTFAGATIPYPGARRAMAACRALLRACCPTADWTVLRESGGDGLYEWRVAGCPEEPDQHEVGRVMHGRGSWARITFSVRGTMDAPTREEWLRRLSAARLVPGAP